MRRCERLSQLDQRVDCAQALALRPHDHRVDLELDGLRAGHEHVAEAYRRVGQRTDPTRVLSCSAIRRAGGAYYSLC